MRQREIRKKFDEIVDFAQVAAFIDTPVKRYSSGMHVRLGFAVAAHLEPDILIVDEVLAVGDAEFQKKCLGKMDEISRRQGRTVLLVSHQMGVVASLCRFAIWLDHGSIRQFGNAREVIDGYLTNQTVSRDRSVNLARFSHRRDDAEVRITLVLLEWLCDLPLRHGERVKARLHFTTAGSIVDLAFTIGFSNLEGQRILSYDSDLGSPRHSVVRAGSYSVVVEVGSLALAPGIYNLDMYVAQQTSSFWILYGRLLNWKLLPGHGLLVICSRAQAEYVTPPNGCGPIEWTLVSNNHVDLIV